MVRYFVLEIFMHTYLYCPIGIPGMLHLGRGEQKLPQSYPATEDTSPQV